MKLILAVLLVFNCSWTFAQAPEKETGTERCFWIAPPNRDLKTFGVFEFEKSIDIGRMPSRVTAQISADNRFKLYVNGKLAGMGPAFSDLDHWRYEEIDITSLLQEGRNEIRALVWNFGEDRSLAQISLQTGFILHCKGNILPELNTDTSWRVREIKSITPIKVKQNHDVIGYYVAGPTERHQYGPNKDTLEGEAPILLQAWETPEMDYGDQNYRLVSNPLPQMTYSAANLGTVRNPLELGAKHFQGFLDQKHDFKVNPDKSLTYLLDFGKLTTAYPRFSFSGGKGSTITFSYAESLYLTDSLPFKGHRDSIAGKKFIGYTDSLVVLDNNKNSFEPLWWRTFRYLKINITTQDEPLLMTQLDAAESFYPFEAKSSFELDSFETKQLMETGWRTLQLCSHETFMDCPYYEQLQYVGDTRIQALTSLWSTGDSRLMYNAIDQMANSITPMGLTESRYPSRYRQLIPTFSLWWVAMVHDYYMYVNPQIPAHWKKGVVDVLTWYSQQERLDGLLKPLPYWDFTDWTTTWTRGKAPKTTRYASCATQMQYLLALKQSQDFMGKYPFYHQEKIKQKLTLLESYITKRYWNEQDSLFSDTENGKLYSQHAQALAIISGLVEGDQSKKLLQKTLSDSTLTPCSIYFKFYLHEAIYQAKLQDQYLDQLGFWRGKLEEGVTTWPEEFPPSRSDCHAWGSSPNLQLYTVYLGIRPGLPGFASINIRPPKDLNKNLDAKFSHRFGMVGLTYNKETKQYTVSLPPGLAGTLELNNAHLLKPGSNTIKLDN